MTFRQFSIFAAFIVGLLSSFSPAGAATFTSVNVPKAIPDFANGVPGTITSTLTVPAGACTSVTDVNVSINITHPLLSDLEVSITRNGSGVTSLLFQNSCTSNNDLIALFDDEAASLPLVCTANSVYRPESPLSTLDGIDAAGTWTLTVKDQATLDTGTLNGWGITLTCGGSSRLSVAVSGNGSVNSTPGGIACAAGISGGCAADFSAGQQVTLIPAASSGSMFGSWSGGCASITGSNCNVILDSDKSVTATFIAQPPVSSGGNYYDSLQSAYDAGSSTPTIQAQQVVLPPLDFTLNGGKAVIFKGGYDSAYSGNSGGYTELDGVLTIQSGSLTVENLIIR